MSAISRVCDQTPGQGVLLQEEGGCVSRTVAYSFTEIKSELIPIIGFVPAQFCTV